MRHLLKVIKGSLVGIGSILPGISGSMVAAILKIYQDLIDALNQVTHHPIQAIKSVWQYIVGVVVGLIIGFVFVRFVFDEAPIPVTFLFIGFILGAIPVLVKEVQHVKIKWHHVVVFIVAIVSMVGVIFITGSEVDPTSWVYYVVIVLIGIIYAIALIIPGLSGSTMLLAFGFFHLLLNIISDVGIAIATLDFSLLISQLPILLLLVLGTLIGLVGMGKVMHFLFHKYKVHFYLAVLGIVIVSPLNIIITLHRELSTGFTNEAWYVYVMSGMLLLLGLVFTFFISTRKKDKTEELND